VQIDFPLTSRSSRAKEFDGNSPAPARITALKSKTQPAQDPDAQHTPENSHSESPGTARTSPRSGPRSAISLQRSAGGASTRFPQAVEDGTLILYWYMTFAKGAKIVDWQ